MILIIGGTFQGKKAFAEKKCGITRWVDGANCSPQDIETCEGLFHFHEYIHNRLKEGDDCTQLAERIQKKNPGIVLVTNELGYGVVPIEAFDRKYRETTGRVCTALAGQADEVYRVICGIGVKLKG